MGNSSFMFAPAVDQNSTNHHEISFGAKSTFGLQSYCSTQEHSRFVCEQIHDKRFLQSKAWLLQDEEWVAVSPFQSVEYSRPLRVGDLFLLKTVGEASTNQKFMTNPEHDHLVLCSSPSEACYLMVTGDTHGRFVFEA